MQPTSLLSTPLAKTYTYIHTLLVLSLYYMRFADLVADPVTTLWGLAVPVAVCQGICCVICLSVGGSGSGDGGKGTTANQGKLGQRKGKGKGKGKETDGDAEADMGTRVKVRFFCPSLCPSLYPSHTSSLSQSTTVLDY